mgnify:FL=1
MSATETLVALPVNTAAATYSVGQRVTVTAWDGKEATITRIPPASAFGTGDYGVELQFTLGASTHHFFSNHIASL